MEEALEIFRRLGAKKDVERTEQTLAELAAVQIPSPIESSYRSEALVA